MNPIPRLLIEFAAFKNAINYKVENIFALVRLSSVQEIIKNARKQPTKAVVYDNAL